MIIKTRSITKDHAYNTLGYVIKEEKDHIILDADGADISSASLFIGDCCSFSKNNVKKEFVSTVISPHVGDNLSIEDMKKLLHEVRLQLGLDNRQFFAVIHQNTATPHIHVISNRINYKHETWKDHHIAWKCQEACQKVSIKLNLTSAFSKKGTYDKSKIQDKSKFHSQNEKNIQYIKNHFADIKYKATHIDEVFKYLKMQGIEVRVSKFKNGLFGVSMQFNGTVVKGSKVDRLLTLLPNEDSYKANNRMQKIFDNNQIRIEGRRSFDDIGIEIGNTLLESSQSKGFVYENFAFLDHQQTLRKGYGTISKGDEDQEIYRKRRKKRKFNI